MKSSGIELGWSDADSTVLIARIPPRTRISVVRSLLNQKGKLESDVASRTRLFEEATDAHAKLNRELERVGEPADTSRLAITLKAVRGKGDIAGQVSAAESALKKVCGQVRRRLDSLNPSVEDEEVLTAMKVPVRAQLRGCREAQLDWIRRSKEARQMVAAVQQELDSAVAAFDRAVRDEQVVTAEELKGARVHRGVVWELIKLKYIERKAIPKDQADQYKEELRDLAGTFEAAVIRTDELADRRFDHAAAVGRIAEIERKIGEQEILLEQAQKNEKKLVEEGEQLTTEWRALWAGAPFDPEMPETMLVWLDDRDRVLEAAETREEAENALEVLRGEEQEARQQLLGDLAALGIPVSMLEDDRLTIVVERAGEELRVRESEADRKSQLEKDIEDAAKNVAQRQRDLELAKRELSAWQGEWSAALGDLGLAADVAAEAVSAQIDILDQMRETAGRINSLRNDRIEKIQRDVADFESVVRELVQVVAADLNGNFADDAVAALETRLNEAERIQGLRERQNEEVVGLKNKIETLQDHRVELAASILHLKQTANADNNEALKAAIDRSDRWRSIQFEQQQITAKLHQDGDGKSIDGLDAECDGLAIDEVTAQEESLETELDDLRQQQAEAADIRSQARQAFLAIGGDDAAAKAAAEKEEALTEMGEVAERYVRVKTSAVLLQWAIDRYRREKQVPLLKRAGELFQILTDGSFDSLEVTFDDQDHAHLTGVRPNAKVVPVSGMSTGTADQLYLALRIASIEDYLERADTLPFFADDLFINFDDSRAAAGFRLLGQLATKTQVFFFTHHQHLVDIASKTLDVPLSLVTLAD